MPILFSFLPTLTPRSFSTMKMDIPWVPFSLSVTARTVNVSAMGPLEMKVLVPFRM